MVELPDRWRELGEFIREQRAAARLSLRRLSAMAGVSNPYLSQIERGMRRPSAEVLQQIAKALRISATTLYVRAGILEDHEAEHDVEDAILGEGTLTDDQKQTLIRLYRFFGRRGDAAGPGAAPVDGDGLAAGLADPGLAAPGLTDPGLIDPGLAAPGLIDPGLAEPAGDHAGPGRTGSGRTGSSHTGSGDDGDSGHPAGQRSE